MKRIELKSIDNEEIIRFECKGEKYYFQGFEANLINDLKKLPPENRIQLMHLSEKDCLEYFKQKRQSYREYALEVLSKNWYSRETDARFTLKNFDCEFIDGWPSFQKVKNDVKNDKLDIDMLSKIIEYFTADDSEFYSKEN